MLRQGAGTPLVLLHGLFASETMWRRTMAPLAAHHDTIAFTVLGHRGGNGAWKRPVTLAKLVDDAEQALDALRIDRAHFAGVSLGGWLALELARRGRSLSVCAFSPAGCWKSGRTGRRFTARAVHTLLARTRIGRETLSRLVRSGAARRSAALWNQLRGGGPTHEELVDLADDLLDCTIGVELLRNTRDALAPLDPLPCPVTIAWGERDIVFPIRTSGAIARRLVPQARFVVLKGIGHAAMFDAPEVAVRTILESTERR